MLVVETSVVHGGFQRGEEDHCLYGSSAHLPVCGYPMMKRRPRAWDSPHLGPIKGTCAVVCSQHIEKSYTKGLSILWPAPP